MFLNHCQMSAIKDSLPSHILVNLKAIKEVKNSVLNILSIKMNFQLISSQWNSFSHRYVPN